MAFQQHRNQVLGMLGAIGLGYASYWKANSHMSASNGTDVVTGVANMVTYDIYEPLNITMMGDPMPVPVAFDGTELRGYTVISQASTYSAQPSQSLRKPSMAISPGLVWLQMLEFLLPIVCKYGILGAIVCFVGCLLFILKAVQSNSAKMVYHWTRYLMLPFVFHWIRSLLRMGTKMQEQGTSTTDSSTQISDPEASRPFLALIVDEKDEENASLRRLMRTQAGRISAQKIEIEDHKYEKEDLEAAVRRAVDPDKMLPNIRVVDIARFVKRSQREALKAKNHAKEEHKEEKALFEKIINGQNKALRDERATNARLQERVDELEGDIQKVRDENAKLLERERKAKQAMKIAQAAQEEAEAAQKKAEAAQKEAEDSAEYRLSMDRAAYEIMFEESFMREAAQISELTRVQAQVVSLQNQPTNAPRTSTELDQETVDKVESLSAELQKVKAQNEELAKAKADGETSSQKDLRLKTQDCTRLQSQVSAANSAETRAKGGLRNAEARNDVLQKNIDSATGKIRGLEEGIQKAKKTGEALKNERDGAIEDYKNLSELMENLKEKTTAAPPPAAVTFSMQAPVEVFNQAPEIAPVSTTEATKHPKFKELEQKVASLTSDLTRSDEEKSHANNMIERMHQEHRAAVDREAEERVNSEVSRLVEAERANDQLIYDNATQSLEERESVLLLNETSLAEECKTKKQELQQRFEAAVEREKRVLRQNFKSEVDKAVDKRAQASLPQSTSASQTGSEEVDQLRSIIQTQTDRISAMEQIRGDEVRRLQDAKENEKKAKEEENSAQCKAMRYLASHDQLQAMRKGLEKEKLEAGLQALALHRSQSVLAELSTQPIDDEVQTILQELQKGETAIREVKQALKDQTRIDRKQLLNIINANEVNEENFMTDAADNVPILKTQAEGAYTIMIELLSWVEGEKGPVKHQELTDLVSGPRDKEEQRFLKDFVNGVKAPEGTKRALSALSTQQPQPQLEKDSDAMDTTSGSSTQQDPGGPALYSPSSVEYLLQAASEGASSSSSHTSSRQPQPTPSTKNLVTFPGLFPNSYVSAPAPPSSSAPQVAAAVSAADEEYDESFENDPAFQDIHTPQTLDPAMAKRLNRNVHPLKSRRNLPTSFLLSAPVAPAPPAPTAESTSSLETPSWVTNSRPAHTLMTGSNPPLIPDLGPTGWHNIQQIVKNMPTQTEAQQSSTLPLTDYLGVQFNMFCPPPPTNQPAIQYSIFTPPNAAQNMAQPEQNSSQNQANITSQQSNNAGEESEESEEE